MDERPTRHLRWDACYNLRELGGIPTQDGGQIGWRALLRADTLSRLTPEGEAALLAYGVGTIIDLRSEDERIASPYPLMHRNSGPPIYLNLPMLDEEDGAWQAAMKRDVTHQEFYRLMLDRFQRQIGTIVSAVANAAPGSVLLHCYAGKDRTGIAIALLLALAGVPTDEIAVDYGLSQEALHPYLQTLLAEVPDDPAAQKRLKWAYASDPETMVNLLSYLDARYGGVEAYLLAAGVTQQEVERIRRRLRAPLRS